MSVYHYNGERILSGSRDDIEKVIVERDVDSIYPSVFQNCRYLELVEFEKGSELTSIGSGAFLGCRFLESITIPSTVTHLGRASFYNCYRLPSIVIPDKVTRIFSHTFEKCAKLKDVSIGKEVGAIHTYAFDSCTNIETLIIKGNPTINNSSFDTMKNLSHIELTDEFISSQSEIVLSWIETGNSLKLLNDILSRNKVSREFIENLMDKFSGNAEITTILLNYSKGMAKDYSDSLLWDDDDDIGESLTESVSIDDELVEGIYYILKSGVTVHGDEFEFNYNDKDYRCNVEESYEKGWMEITVIDIEEAEEAAYETYPTPPYLDESDEGLWRASMDIAEEIYKQLDNRMDESLKESNEENTETINFGSGNRGAVLSKYEAETDDGDKTIVGTARMKPGGAYVVFRLINGTYLVNIYWSRKEAEKAINKEFPNKKKIG